LGKPGVERNAELEQIVTTVGELLCQYNIVKDGVLRAKQTLAIRNQGVEMPIRIRLGRRDATQYRLRRIQVTRTLRGMDLACHIAHVIPLIGVRGKRQLRTGYLQVSHP